MENAGFNRVLPSLELLTSFKCCLTLFLAFSCMWRELNPICLYLRGAVRTVLKKKKLPSMQRIHEWLHGKEKKNRTEQPNKPDLPLGKSRASQLFSGSGVSCYINILEALQKGWHSHHICGAWLIGFCVWRMGMARDKEVKSPRCKQGLLLPMAYTAAYVL